MKLTETLLSLALLLALHGSAAGQPDSAPSSQPATLPATEGPRPPASPASEPAQLPGPPPAVASVHAAAEPPRNLSWLDRQLVPAARKRLLDHRVEPTALIRTSLVTTMEDHATVRDSAGAAIELDTTKMDPSIFGHREGFVLENVELGFKGRFNSIALYYKAKFELVPREKDGNRSSDYLKDAYFGWNRWRFLDIRIGRMKTNISRTNMMATEDYNLVYAPVLDTLTPKRQLGGLIALTDPWDLATVQAGLYNSVALASEMINSTDQLIWALRFDVRVHRALGLLGRDWSWFEWEIGANIARVKEHYDPPVEHRWWVVDTRLRVWRFLLDAEVVVTDFFSEPLADGSQPAERGWGWHATLTAEVLPRWLNLSLRIEESDGDSVERGLSATLSISELSKQKKRWITAGAQLLLWDRARVNLNYINRKELEGYDFSNDVVIGMFQYHI